MPKLCRSHYNAHCHLLQVTNLFLSTYSVFNPSYSFSETDSLAWCSLVDLSTHIVKRRIFYRELEVRWELKNIDCFVLLLKYEYDKLGPYPEFGDSRI